jgi:hypothetical protein
MTDQKTALLYYPGHLGPAPTTHLRRYGTKVVWNAPVKAVPAPSAAGLVRFGGFLRAHTLPEAAALRGLELAAVERLAAEGHLHVEKYQPRDGAALDVVVMDAQTISALRPAPPAAPSSNPPAATPRTLARKGDRVQRDAAPAPDIQPRDQED